MENIGNQLYRLVNEAQTALFNQGELAQLTYGAFDIAARSMQESKQEEIEVTFPIGYRADKTAMEGKRTYNKEQLLGRYQYLAFHQLSVNGVVQLITIVEAMLGDVVRAIVTKYPQKLGSKRNIPMKEVLESSSIEEIHLRACDSFLNDLSYKSPADFAEAVQGFLSLNLFECPAFHKYIEAKATRDVYIHNRGVANDVYVRKSGAHARVKSGMQLPVEIQYFLESYETCIQFTEWLETKLHENWHSSELEDYKKRQLEMSLPEKQGDA